jgi:hypothetical protein
MVIFDADYLGPITLNRRVGGSNPSPPTSRLSNYLLGVRRGKIAGTRALYSA